MTQTSAFHFESLVWDWPIAIYLFLIGISAGLVTLAVLLRRFYPQAGGADSTLLRTTLIVGPGAVILGLLILVFHLTRPWTFWKLMFHYSFTSVMSMGVMLFQLYMVVLLLWLAKIFEHDLLALQQRWLPKLGIVQKVLSLLTPVHRGLETLMLVLAVFLWVVKLVVALVEKNNQKRLLLLKQERLKNLLLKQERKLVERNRLPLRRVLLKQVNSLWNLLL